MSEADGAWNFNWYLCRWTYKCKLCVPHFVQDMKHRVVHRDKQPALWDELGEKIGSFQLLHDTC